MPKKSDIVLKIKAERFRRLGRVQKMLGDRYFTENWVAKEVVAGRERGERKTPKILKRLRVGR